MTFGKQVGRRVYLHTSLYSYLSEAAFDLIARASDLVRLPREAYNVLRLEQDTQAVAFLNYPAFFESAFPALEHSWNVRVDSRDWSYRTYEQSRNPPILHRKELLLPSDDRRISEFSALTQALEKLGLFDDPVRIGFQLQWSNLLRQRGFQVIGHRLVPIGNDESAAGDVLQEVAPSAGVARHLTALTRSTLSAPIQLLHKHKFLEGPLTVFDYGCGRGSDLHGLSALGLECAGWDPYYSPDTSLKKADIVNLGFVINVIEDPVERRTALLNAWALANQLLVVSAMIAAERSIEGTPYADGIITRRGTFQKYYTQEELRDYLGSTLGTTPIGVAPGVFFIFKSEELEQRFQTGRYRTRLRLFPRELLASTDRPQRAPRPTRPTVYALHQPLVDAIWAQALELGREPIDEEVPQHLEVHATLGSSRRAMNIALRHHDVEALAQARQQRTDDRLVFFALQEFQKRPPYKHLNATLQRDVRAFFGDYQSARAHGRKLLQDAANPDVIESACGSAASAGLGFHIPGKSLELSSRSVSRLPPVLRVYAGCAALLDDSQASADLIKIHVLSGKVSLMHYNDFSSLPLPRLVKRTKINLRTQAIQTFEYGKEFEPPILYLKSRYMNEEDDLYPEQVRFDEELQRIVDLSGHGPRLGELAIALKRARKSIKGYEVVANHTVPNVDDQCGRYFTYRQLIECGETQARLGLANVPKQGQTFSALNELATNIIDPAVEYFGSIELTYGFCSAALSSHIHARVAPSLDQHAAHELKRNGSLICSRKGAAVDFLVRDEDMREVAEWIVANLPFDRLYYYGTTRPIHVSYGPENSRKAYEMVPSRRGTLIPRPFVATTSTTEAVAPPSSAS